MYSISLPGSSPTLPSLNTRRIRSNPSHVISHSFACQPLSVSSTHRSARRSTVVRAVAGVEGDGPSMDEKISANSQAPSYSLPKLPDWSKWLVSIAFWLALPGWKKLQGVGDSLKKIDAVVEVIHEIADKADHIAEDINKALPQGPMKEAVVKFEKAAEEVERTTKVLDESIDKITDMIDGKDKEEKENPKEYS